MLDAPRTLLALSVAMILLIVAATFWYETAWSTPEPHPRIPAMEIGGARAFDDAEHWGLGLAFGVVTILSLVATLSFAIGHSKFASQLKLALFAGGLVYVAVFVVMMLTQRTYTQQGPSMLGPFATPTTWMVFGLWSTPALFVVIYCVKFNTWFATDSANHSADDSN